MKEKDDFSSIGQSYDSSETGTKSSADSMPLWAGLLLQMAQDYRQDLMPGSVKYWRLKLVDYRDEEIYEALLGYNEQWFPKIPELRERMDLARERRAEERAAALPQLTAGEMANQADWECFKRENGLPKDLTFQRYYVQQNKEQFDTLWARIVRK